MEITTVGLADTLVYGGEVPYHSVDGPSTLVAFTYDATHAMIKVEREEAITTVYIPKSFFDKQFVLGDKLTPKEFGEAKWLECLFKFRQGISLKGHLPAAWFGRLYKSNRYSAIGLVEIRGHLLAIPINLLKILNGNKNP